MTVTDAPASALLQEIKRLARVTLCDLPSALQHAPRFSAQVGVEVWLKRDDLLGPAFGGNKVRKLELLLGDAKAQGADCVITCGAAQSNHARLTAACARLVGLEPFLVLRSIEAAPVQGNLLLDYLLGANVQIEAVGRTSELQPVMETLAAQLRAEGRRPYVITVGGSTPLGAAAYAEALMELDEQARNLKLASTTVFHATSSGGTQAGMAVGAAALAAGGRAWNVIGVDVDGDPHEVRGTVVELARETGRFLTAGGAPVLDAEPHVNVLGGYAGAGYGLVSDDGRAAIRLLAETEGVFVDPVYAGKALAGLIGEARAGRLTRSSNVVFWHTGGAPALFAYADTLR